MTSETLKIQIVQVPEDNSCLFHCILRTCFTQKKDKEETIESMRRLCAYLMDTSKEFIAFLETVSCDPLQAISNVLKPDSWGGPDELAVYSQFKEVEFVLISEKDKCVISRIRFPDSAKYTKRVYLYWCTVSRSESKRMVHYNYFADESGNGMFDEKVYDDSTVIKAIERCIGKVPKSMTQLQDSLAKLTLTPPDLSSSGCSTPIIQKADENTVMVECPVCKIVTLYRLPKLKTQDFPEQRLQGS
jgi:hypothetical protein